MGRDSEQVPAAVGEVRREAGEFGSQRCGRNCGGTPVSLFHVGKPGARQRQSCQHVKAQNECARLDKLGGPQVATAIRMHTMAKTF
jgi:hypothetical protein